MAHPSTGEPILRDPGRREPGKPLRSVADLVAAGLADPTRMDALEQVAARYAVAITPAMADLIDRCRSGRSDRAPVRAGRGASWSAAAGELADPIGDARPQPGRGHRPPLSRPRAAEADARLRGLLPLLLPARDGRPRGPAPAAAAGLDAAPGLHRARGRRSGRSIVTGGDPFMPVAAPPARHGRERWRRSSTSRSSASTPACRWSSPSGSRDELVARAAGAGKAVYVALHANHPRELTPAARAACGTARRRRHPAAEPDRAAARRQRRSGDARTR